MICFFLDQKKKKKGSTGFISQQAGRACAMRKQAPRADNSDKDDALKLQVCFSTIDSTPGRILRLRCSILEKKLRKSLRKSFTQTAAAKFNLVLLICNPKFFPLQLRFSNLPVPQTVGTPTPEFLIRQVWDEICISDSSQMMLCVH